MLFSCFPVTSQSATSYTAVYAAVGSFVATFVVTALICGIIVMAILRYDIIVTNILSFSSIFFFWTANIKTNDKRGHFNKEDDVDYLISIGAGSVAPLGVALESEYSQSCIKRSPLGQIRSGLIRQVTS